MEPGNSSSESIVFSKFTVFTSDTLLLAKPFIFRWLPHKSCESIESAREIGAHLGKLHIIDLPDYATAPYSHSNHGKTKEKLNPLGVPGLPDTKCFAFRANCILSLSANIFIDILRKSN